MRVQCNRSETVKLAPGNSFTRHEGITDFGSNRLTLELTLCLLPAGGYLQCTFLFLVSSDSLGERSLSKRDTVGQVIKQLASDEVSWHTWVSCSVSESPTVSESQTAVLESVTAVLDVMASGVLTVGQDYFENSRGILALFPNTVLLFPNYA